MCIAMKVVPTRLPLEYMVKLKSNFSTLIIEFTDTQVQRIVRIAAAAA
jgi:hypothetical protein